MNTAVQASANPNIAWACANWGSRVTACWNSSVARSEFCRVAALNPRSPRKNCPFRNASYASRFVRAALAHTGLAVRGQLQAQLRDQPFGHLVLDREDVGGPHIEAIGPE